VVARGTVGSGQAGPPEFIVMSGGGRPLFQALPVLERARRRIARGLIDRRFANFCAVQLAELNPDVVHFHFGTTAALVWRSAHRLGIPYVVTFYGFDISAGIRQKRWRLRIGEMARSAAAVIVLCDAAKGRIVDLGCSPSNVLVWNLPAGIERFSYQQRRDGGPVRFVTAARFVEKKGYPTLLDAFVKVREKHPDAKLIAIGYGPLRDRISEAIEQKDLAQSVSLIDSSSGDDFFARYADLLRQSDIFVLPSIAARNGDDEGGPALSMVAAQAAGVPVISTPFPGAERSVIDGVTGLYCRENDAESLADRMSYLASNPEMIARLGETGSTYVRQNFAAEDQVSKLLAVYRTLPRET
jgi:colanic acid/amylovoran biosynthesis glycosyltransferase